MRALTLLLATLALLAGCGSPEPAPAPLAPLSPPEPVLVAEPAGLDIPSIGVHVEGISELTLDANDAMEIPEDPAVVGWYPLGPAPGEVGPAILTGHVNYDGHAGVFARLHEMKAGDQISVPRADGTTAAFVVYAVDQHAKDQFPTEKVYGNRPDPELVLITCGGELDGHSYRDNIVVSARLAA